MAGLIASCVVAAQPAFCPAAAQTVPADRSAIRLSFAPVVKRTAPAVVNVYARQVVRERVRSPVFDDPFFRRFFGDNGFGMPRERVSNSLGSGVIVSPDGVVVTNNHVVKDGTDIRVALADKREFEAEVLQRDERTDLAVLKIVDGHESFPHLAFADSDAVEIGDLVLAVGNPFGIGQTVTSGIVSALARTQIGVADYRFFIQTDAAINPGNSGGPLVDVDGRVIGINTAIYSRSGGSNGIGFAIPSNMVRIVVDSAVSGERLRRPWVGARFQEMTADIAETLGLDRPAGALVTELYPGGPLQAAGLKPGDVIMKVDEFEIEDSQALSYRLTTRGIGGKARLEFRRGSGRFETWLAVVAAPEDPPRDERVLRGGRAMAGARVANLSPAVAEELDLDPMAFEGGVVVTGVAPASPAARVGLRRGDVVLGVDNAPVGSVDELEAALSSAGPLFDLTIRRGRQVVTTRLRG